MWPTPVYRPGERSGWAALDRRARTLALLGLTALAVATVATAWLSMRLGQPSTPVYGGGPSSPAAFWTWDGATYSETRIAAGPSSNDADMAYDRAHAQLVLWDHGCARLKMGFDGGCAQPVDQTWIQDGGRWTARSPRSSPVESGRGAMLYDSRLERVVYVNGVGRAWTWTGADWQALALPGAPAVPTHGSAAAASTFAAGYDEGRRALVFALTDSTWTWDGAHWTETKGGIGLDEARDDAHLVYDGARGQLVYVGSRRTWTWDGARWQPHDQPDIASGTLGYDAARGAVVLVRQDTSDCDRNACHTTTWTWDGASWTRVSTASAPALPVTRSGASAPPMAFDEARGLLVLFASST